MKPLAFDGEIKILQYTWQNYFEMAMSFAKTLITLDIPERSTIIIQGENTPEHLACLMGTILANCIATEIYPNNSHDSCVWQA